MKKYLIGLLAVAMLGCSGTEEPEESADPQGCDTECEVVIGPESDMSGYTELEDTHVFTDTTVQTMVRSLEEGQTFVVYFGFVRCPWCQEAVPVLAEAAEDAGMKVGYINTRPSDDIHSNIEIPDYDMLVDAVGSYFPPDDNNIPHLYTPFVFFVKDGEVVLAHQGTVEEHDAHERQMTDEERTELRKIYDEGFSALK